MAAEIIEVRTKNNDYQHVEVLKRNRRKRQQYGRFLVEGVRPINQMLSQGWAVEAFIYGAKRKADLSSWARDILSGSHAPVHYQLSPELMDQLSDREDTSELMALAAMPSDDLDRISRSLAATPHQDPLLVLLDRPISPGNLGSVLRSCDCFGAQGVIVVGHSADLYDPQTIRSSVGSIFSLPVVRQPSFRELSAWIAGLRRRYTGFQVVGSSAGADTDLASVSLQRPTCLLVGNETVGLSKALKEASDVMARIPMYGTASSLNLACAATVMLYEADRQRQEGSGGMTGAT